MEKLPIYRFKVGEDDEAEVTAVALVDMPAIEMNWQAFRQEMLVSPKEGESKDEFVSRCIGIEVGNGYEQEQAAAMCYAKWDEKKFTGEKVSFDFDETLNTAEGMKLAMSEIDKGNDVYIISARGDKESMLSVADELGIPHDKVFATGSNKAKVDKIVELGIKMHYDNNADVIKALGTIGEKFAESYTDYPEAAKENAKIALRWAEENGWGDCGTPVGKQRANQLANGEAISRDTIARMAAFERHRQNSNKKLGDGCGRLMWLAWGGDEGIAWAQRKLEQIDKKQFKFAADKEKRIISGPLMVADLPILRIDENGEYYGLFTAEDIYNIRNKFFKKSYTKEVNAMHDSNQMIEGVYMIESFLIDSKRGIHSPAGFKLTDGSWFGSYKVDNDEVWNEFIKTGKFKGFSVEGVFNMVKIDKKPQTTIEKIIEIVKQIED